MRSTGTENSSRRILRFEVEPMAHGTLEYVVTQGTFCHNKFDSRQLELCLFESASTIMCLELLQTFCVALVKSTLRK